MNAKKIFKTILGVGTLVGTAYIAYRTGYQNGKDAKLPEKTEIDEFDGTGDEDDDSDDTDEDSDSLNDTEEIPCKPETEVPDTSQETSRFKHFSKVDIGNVYIGDLIYAVEVISKKTISSIKFCVTICSLKVMRQIKFSLFLKMLDISAKRIIIPAEKFMSTGKITKNCTAVMPYSSPICKIMLQQNCVYQRVPEHL